ncbi:MAG: SusC/RagA family TonB-linked outer membrane protein [Salinivirgaceae bacterium]|jgi:TonB-linked SusC/RagA family outer membrane protein|nr:SusC/RagA family TonB-linked outer membrane protein [Salinivirgaceae bacterium]
MRVYLLLIFAFLSTCLAAQQSAITGTVVSCEDKATLPGVSVSIKGTSTGTITDIDGKYSLTANVGDVVVFSFVGMLTEEIPVETISAIDVSLCQDLISLGEVVITALGISREKKSLGYSVTDVKGEEFSQNRDKNIVSSLSGKVAGVQVTQVGGGLGSSSRLVIRGNTSITGNNQPLYVIDGIPVNNSSYADNGSGIWDRKDNGSGISDINPDDIESMTVLKGPNAAALYGSRAANGAIIIVTKSGKASKGIGIEFSSSTTIDKITNSVLPKYQNEYGRGINNVYDLNTGMSWGPKFDGSNQASWNSYKPTLTYSSQKDNVKDYFDMGYSTTNTVALSKGTETSSIRFSYTNLKASGIIPNNDQKRHSFNLRATTKLNDKISFDAKVNYITQEISGRTWLGNSANNVIQSLFLMPRETVTEEMKQYQNVDGTQNRPTLTHFMNPYWVNNYDINKDSRDRLIGMAKLDYKLTTSLSAFIRIGTDYSVTKTEEYNQPEHVQFPDGRLQDRSITNTESNFDFLLKYNKDLTESLNLMVNAGGNIRYEQGLSQGYLGLGYKTPEIYSITNAENIQSNDDVSSEKMVQSLYGSATASYRSVVYVDVTARNDWSSTLPKDNLSYFYPSATLSLILTEALSLPEAISFAKLRGGWAKVGNDTDPYSIWKNVQNQSYQYNGLALSDVDFIDEITGLKPEITKSLEFGLNASILDNTIYFDFTYYNSATENQIIRAQLPATTAYANRLVNGGLVRNKGIEFLIGGYPVKTKDFTWDISLNLAKNETKVEELYADLTTQTLGAVQNVAGGAKIVTTAKGGYGDIVGYDYNTDDNGNLILNDNGTFIKSSEEVLLGNVNPKLTGGLTNKFDYKNFSLKFLIDFRIGGDILAGTNSELMAYGLSEESLEGRESGFQMTGVNVDGNPVNANITAQDYYGSLAANVTTPFIVDATNFRLRELALTFKLPAKFIEKTIFQKATFSLTGRNLFFLYRDADAKHFDPEVTYSSSNSQGVTYFDIPTPTTFGFNLNLTF